MSKISAMFTADTSGLKAGTSQASAAMRQMRGDVGSLEAAMNRLSKAVNLNTLVQFGQLAASAARGLYSAMAPAIGSAVSLGEELSKSAQIFGENAGEIDKFAKSAAALGMTRVQALEAAGSFGNMFTSMKLGTDQSAEMSLTFTRLAADLASFNNTSVDEAITALGATLRGESEPIRRFGVLLDDATLKAKAFELGMTKSAKDAMTPAIKAQAAYAAVLEQTAKAQGDFARTSGGLANMGRQLQAEAGNAAQTLGAAFVPVLESFGAGVLRTFQQLQPMIAEASSWLVNAWNQYGPAISGAIFDVMEMVARRIDFTVQLFGMVFDYARNVFNYFSDMIPSFGEEIDWFEVVVNMFERAGNLVEAALRGASGAFTVAVATLMKGAGYVAGIFAKAAEVLGFSADALRNYQAAANNLGKEWMEGGTASLKQAAQLTKDAFSEDFTPGRVGRMIRDAMTDGWEGGAEDMVERFRLNFEDAGRGAVQIAAQQLGKTVGAGVTATIQSAAKNVGIDATSTSGVAFIANAINASRGDVSKKQLDVLKQIAANTTDMIPAEAVAIP